MPTRAQLDADLHALEQTLPVQGTADATAFDPQAFQARIAELMRIADPADQEHVRERAVAMLTAAGLPLPGPVAGMPPSGRR